MKALAPLLVASVIHFACTDGGTTQPELPMAEVFEIHLQTWFSNTPVAISVDQGRVFNDTVTTGSSLAVAAIIPVHLTQGVHRLNVTVAGTVSKDTTFTISDSLFVGVGYDMNTETITYRFQRNRFPYR